MNTTPPADTVWFTTKGQVVIPLRLRKLFHIEDGTRVIVTATDEGKGVQRVPLPGYQRYVDDFKELAAAVRGEKALTASLDEELLVAETVLRASAML